MQNKTTDKIRDIDRIGSIVAEEKREARRIVHCHGVFDLLHPGHLRHLQEAKKQGDKLIVSITPDRYVNKGPGRPAFSEKLRLEQLAALVYVDYVVLNDSPDAVSIIKKIKPDIYVKGSEYRQFEADITGMIVEETEAVREVGGKIFFTEDIVFSSSELINRFFDEDAIQIGPFINRLKEQLSLSQVLDSIEQLKKLNVLVIGDAIIDEYQYVEPLGQSGKGVHLTARLLEKEIFLGGSLIIANHLSSFLHNVTLLTALGKECSHIPLIKEKLAPNVQGRFIYFDNHPTLTKTRFVLQDGKTITKLFETYSSNHSLLNECHTQEIISYLISEGDQYDLIIVSDFGNGFINSPIVNTLCQRKAFLAINTQTNSGNRGYNVVTHYHRADFVSLNEPELRLAAHDRDSRLDTVANDIAEILRCSSLSVTRGVKGVNLYHEGNVITIPALTSRAVDRVGAGDSYFALASLLMAQTRSPWLAGFVGSAAAAMGVQIIGNKESIHKTALCKYITRLLK